MKRKKSTKINTDTALPFNGVVYTTKFINYTDNGKVVSISFEKEEGYKFLEIELDLIPNFVSFNKSFHNYTIEYFRKIKDGLLTDSDEEDTIVKTEYTYYTIPKQVGNSEVIIEHNLANKHWLVRISDVLNLENLSDFSFHVAHLNNKNFLISSYTVQVENIIDNKIIFEFNSSEEQEFDKIQLLTYKKFKSYSVKEIK